jgi:hypothetical protein
MPEQTFFGCGLVRLQTLSSNTGHHLADLTCLHGDGLGLELIDSD